MSTRNPYFSTTFHGVDSEYLVYYAQVDSPLVCDEEIYVPISTSFGVAVISPNNLKTSVLFM